MSKHLLSAFATREPERFAELLGKSEDVQSTLAILTDIPDGMECDVVSRLTPEAAGRLLNGLTDNVLVSWLESASLDTSRGLLSKINSERASRLIAGVGNASKRRRMRRLAGYPAGSIGELVQTQMILIKENTPADKIAGEIRRQAAASAGPVLIERSDGTFKGTLDLARLIQNTNDAAIAADFCTAVKPVYPESLQSALWNSLDWKEETSLPVIDNKGHPIGYISRTVLDKAARPQTVEDPLMASVIELSKRFWEVTAALLVVIFGRRAER